MPTVDIYYADRRTLHEDLVAGLVTEQDRARVTASMVPRRRAEYLASRALLRHALERYTGRAGASFDIHVGADGKPGCVDGPAISLSHSGELVVCAIGAGDALGVDVETSVARTVSPLDIAARYFTAAEAQWVAGAPEARFRMLWVLKEAYLKALGSGIPGGLATLECRVEPPTIVARLAAEVESGAPRLELWRGSGCYLGLAVLGARAFEIAVRRFAPGGEPDAFGPLAPVASTSSRPRSAWRDPR